MPQGIRVASAYVTVEPDLQGFQQKAQADLDRQHLEAKAEVKVDTTSLEKAKLAAQKAALAAAEASDKEAASADKAAAAQKRAAEAAEKLAVSEKAAADAQKASADAAGRLERGEISEAEAKKITADAADKQARAERDATAATEAATKADRASERASIAAAEAKERQAAAAKKAADANLKTTSAIMGLDDSDFRRKIDEDKTKLDELGRKDEHAKVKLDDGDFKERAAADKAAADSLGGGMSGLVPHVSLMTAAIEFAVEALPSFGGALAAVGGGIGVMALALGGVRQALSDYSQSQAQAAQANAQMAATAFSNSVAIQNAEQAITDAKRQAAQQQIASAESIRNAEQGLADARRQAAQTAISDSEAVANAEQALANAEINEQRAQQDLTLARQDATRQLQALNDAQKDATLGVSDAQLALQEALLQQRQTDQNAMTTALQRQEADLSVAKAQQALKEAQEKATNATTDANKANQLGVEGSRTVQDAKNSERLALQAVANAQQSLGDAVRRQANDQISSAEAIAKAEQGLADAQRTAAQQQIASNEAVAKSIRNLQDTQTEQALAAQTAGNQAAKAFQRDMGLMSQAGRDFVNQLISMRGEFKTLTQQVQTTTLPGFTTFLKEISPLIPAITSNLQHMGSTIGGQFSSLGAFLGSGKIQGQIKSILDQGTSFIAILGPALGRMGASLLDLWSKSGAASSGLAKGLGAIADGFAGMFKAMAPGAAAIGSILQTVGTAIGSLGPPLGQVIAALAQGLAPVLKALLPGFTALAQALGPLLAGAIRALAPVLTLVAQNVSALAVALSPVIAKLGDILGKIGPQLTPMTQAMATGFGQIVTAVTPLLGVLPQIAGAIVNLVSVAAKPFTDLVTSLTPIISKLITAAIKPLLPYMTTMTTLFGQIVAALAPLLPPLVKLAGQVLGQLLQALIPILPAMEKLITQLVIAAMQAIIPLLPQIVQLADQFTKLFQQLMPLLPPLIQISTLMLELALKVLPPLMPVLTGGIKIFSDLIGIFISTDNEILKLINWVAKLASEWKRWFNDLWQVIQVWWLGVTTLWRNSTDWIYNTIWKGWIGSIKNAATGLWNDITSGARNFFNGLQGVFSGGVQALGSIWNTIENIFKIPVNFLIGTVYTRGIQTLWNDVVRAIGATNINLPNVSTLAGGGVLPGYAPGKDTVPALLSPGEAVLVPEAVRAVGPGAINALNAQYGGGRKSSVGRYAGGGIVGTIGNIVGGLAGTINSSSWLTGFSLDPMKAVEAILDKVVSTVAHGDYATMMTGIPTTLIHKLAEWAKANAALGSGDGAKAVAYAIAQLGKPYVWGATGPDSFDCSGLTMRAWESAGKEIGRTTYDQINAGRAGSQAQALPGDIHLPEPGHVMMFVKPRSGGADEMIEAPHTGAFVQYAPFRGGGWVRLIATPGGAAGAGGSSQSATAAQDFARAQLGQFGWGPDQFAPLLALWNQESNWTWNATNPSSGAYGIPQSLPADKMASAGADWRTNAYTQIRWGLGYIHDRYGSPSAAESHELSYSWYDQGGYLPPGMSRVVNATGRPEAVLTPEQTQAFTRLADALSRSGGSTPQITINFTGTQLPNVEQMAALKHELASAIGTSG